jgi:hypothetical protein
MRLCVSIRPVREKKRASLWWGDKRTEPFDLGFGCVEFLLLTTTATGSPDQRVFSFGLHHDGQCKQQRHAWRVLLVARSATAHKWAAKIAPMTERLSGVVAPSEDDSRTHRLG